MEELKNEQTETTAQPVETEITNGATETKVSLGKFKDVNSLLSAYNSLEAEFTKRCQRIKELERNVEAGIEKKDKLAPSFLGESFDGTVSITEEMKKQIIEEYLKGIVVNKKPIILADDGASVITPVKKPKTIDEAGTLAKKLFKI